MVYIYSLKLEQGKYYIGKTKNIEHRFWQHSLDNGSYWTKLYKVIELENIYENCDIYDEDKYVIMYMNKYGIDNVRGGIFSSINLTSMDIIYIEKLINGANDKCFKCGSFHFINNCVNKTYNKQIYIQTITKKIKLCCKEEFINIDELIIILQKINNILFNIDNRIIILLCKKYDIDIKENVISCEEFCKMLENIFKKN